MRKKTQNTFIKIANCVLIFCVFGFLFTGCTSKGKNEDNKEHLNRLNLASSPYLKEHADNPVDWYEWGEEALEKAKKENKPLIVSVGYASCHWCHVMERESFMDTAVARLMNENFVSIKVDREERPDIDQIYMNAAQLIAGGGGWPLNAFALPDGKPFYVATYFPKEHWIKVLEQISGAYKNDQKEIVLRAEGLTRGIQQADLITTPVDQRVHETKKMYGEISTHWKSFFDYESGGLVDPPKFPMPAVWEFLLQEHYLTVNKKSLEIVTTTLDKMAKGGIYDQVGGGFARYSTDALWKVPHFEKMLYDNGQMISLYAHAYQVTHDPEYAEVIRESLEFIKREMTSPEGGFYSSLNADSEGEEGKFYVWKKTELESILDGKQAKWFIDYYNVTDSGNWENGKNILYRKMNDDDFIRKHSVGATEWNDILSEAKKIVLQQRSARIRPSLDDKILTSWNALMMNGYIDAYLATGRKEYLESALKNADFLDKKVIRDEGRLWRNYKNGRGSIEAFLDDYAILAKAYIHLYEATFDIHWLEKARLIADYAVNHFRDKQGGLFYYTSDESQNLVARKMELTDHVIPSSNAIMADVLFRLGEYYDENPYREMSQTMMHQVSQEISKNGPYYAHWASLMGLMTHQPYEIAVMGPDAIEKTRMLQRNYLPTAIFMGGEKENLPLLENKYVKGETIIYVCRNRTCKLPVSDVNKALGQLR